MDVIGWAAVLEERGFGPYEVASSSTREGAISKAARALRVTGRPVGLVTRRGAHSWVMSGFRATADPAWDADFEVTGVFVEDTWYPVGQHHLGSLASAGQPGPGGGARRGLPALHAPEGALAAARWPLHAHPAHAAGRYRGPLRG